MKGEGMLGREDQEIARLESCDLSEAQKGDPINYQVGQVVECHHRLKGDLRPGEQWEVAQVLPEAVVVTRNGREKLLPLGQSKEFNVYYRDTVPIAVGEHLLITKNNRRANLRNGEYSAEHERLLITWALGTLVIAGPKVLEFYDDFCNHRATSLKSDRKDILAVTMVLNAERDVIFKPCHSTSFVSS